MVCLNMDPQISQVLEAARVVESLRETIATNEDAETLLGINCELYLQLFDNMGLMLAGVAGILQSLPAIRTLGAHPQPSNN